MQPNLVTTTYKITGLHYIYGCPSLSAASVGWLHVQNEWVTLHLLVTGLKNRPFFLGLDTESLSYNTLMRAPP